MNETLDLIMKRYTCRAFTGTPVLEGSLRTIADAALAAPTAMNRQAFHITVVNDKALMDKLDGECMEVLRQEDAEGAYRRFLDRGGKMFYNAPAMFIISAAPDTQTDVGIVAQNIVLAAESLGLGTCHCGMARLIFQGGQKEAYEKHFRFPEGYEFGLAVLVGAIGEARMPHALDKSKVSVLSAE